MIIYAVVFPGPSSGPRAEWSAPKSCFFNRLHPQAESWQETVKQVGWHTFPKEARVDFVSEPCARDSIETTYYSLWLCCLARMKGVKAREHTTTHGRQFFAKFHSIVIIQKPRFKDRRRMRKKRCLAVIITDLEFDIFGALSLAW